MTKEEKQRGLELQAYIDSIRGMTIKEIATKHLKKHHLPRFLAGLLVKFSAPLLMAKDYELTELEKENAELKEKNKWYSEQVCNKECAEVWGNLTKAKEIIKKLYSHVFQGIGFMELNDYNVQKAEAEQFISEVEK